MIEEDSAPFLSRLDKMAMHVWAKSNNIKEGAFPIADRWYRIKDEAQCLIFYEIANAVVEEYLQWN